MDVAIAQLKSGNVDWPQAIATTETGAVKLVQARLNIRYRPSGLEPGPVPQPLRTTAHQEYASAADIPVVDCHQHMWYPSE